MRILLIGTVEFSKQTLASLIGIGADIVGVVTKSKSKFNADFADLTPLCESHGIPCRCTVNINSAEDLAWMRELQPDIIFCFGWSSLLRAELLGLAAMGVVGYHPAALPANRGRHPIIWALVLGLDETASTFFFMDEGADSGDVLSQVTVPISADDTADSLYRKLTTAGLGQIEKFHKELCDGTFRREEQDHTKANTWRKRGRPDGKVDFRMSTVAIYNLIRGLTRPYVGAHLEVAGEDVKVWSSSAGDDPGLNIEPGKVLEMSGRDVLVKTGNGSIWLVEHEFSTLPQIGDYL